MAFALFVAYLSTNFYFFHLQLSDTSTSNSITTNAMQKSNKENLWNQAQMCNLNCPSLQQLHVCKMLIALLLTN
jgi:hypothetical protein